MSLMGRRYGGQSVSSPLTTRDKIILWSVAVAALAGLAALFGPLVRGILWWVFG